MCERENCAESRPGAVLGKSPEKCTKTSLIKPKTLYQAARCTSLSKSLESQLMFQLLSCIKIYSYESGIWPKNFKIFSHLCWGKASGKKRRKLLQQPAWTGAVYTMSTTPQTETIPSNFHITFNRQWHFSIYIFSVWTLALLALPIYCQRRSFLKQDQLSLQPELCTSL